MTLGQELGGIEELVINRASVAQIRGHILSFRPKLQAKLRALENSGRFKATHALLTEAYEQLQADFTAFKKTAASEKEELEQEIA